MRKFNWCLRRDAIEGEDELKEYRTTPQLNWHQDEYGMVSISAKLPAESGELVIKALEKMVDQMRREQTEKNDDSEEKSGENLGNVSRETFECGIAEPEYPANQAMALANIAEHFLSTSDDGANTLAPTEKYQVLLHINANEAHNDHKITGGPCCYLEEGRFLAPHVARQLTCSASVTPVLEDDEGNVLNIGRRSRTPNRTIALAVERRDGGCRFPNCHQQKWTDQHHIVHWADGGETSVDNLVTLCRHHHTALHKGEYTLRKEAGELRFINKFGKVITRGLYPQFPESPCPSDAIRQFDNACRKRGIKIDKHTAGTLWTGEIMDYDMFIQAMYDLKD